VKNGELLKQELAAKKVTPEQRQRLASIFRQQQ